MAEGAPVQSAPIEVAGPAYPWPVPEAEAEWSKLPTCCSGDEFKGCCKVRFLIYYVFNRVQSNLIF